MKYCTYCGKELFDEAVVCVNCGRAVGGTPVNINKYDAQQLLHQLSQRLHTNAIIWLVIGILQILGGIFLNWFMLVVGVLNIISSINDINYSKSLSEKTSGIVARFEPLAGPIIVLAYNLVIGGVIGVVGSIYYFICIRNFVMENKATFEELENIA